MTQPTFDPGVANMSAVVVAPYADGSEGIDQSIAAMCQKMREGRNDPRVRRWALETLSAAGIDGRGNETVKEKAQVLLDAFREKTSYSPDPVGSEYIPSAAATLCLDPNLCVKGDDCDGLTTAFGSVTMSIGIPTVIVKQQFGNGYQQHVLCAVEDENGQWLYADPSTRMPIGTAAHAQSEERYDPMESNSASTGMAGNEIVTLGRALTHYVDMLGAPRMATLFDQAQIDLSNQVGGPIEAGDTYMTETPPDYAQAVSAYQAAGQAGASVGPEIDLAGAAWVTQPLTHQAWLSNGDLQRMTSAGATAAQAADARTYAHNIQSLLQQAINDGIAAVITGRKQPMASSLTRALFWAGGLGVVGGVGLAVYKSKKKRKR